MRERPILFSAPMVQAILAGRKSQTRRVIKPQPEQTPKYLVNVAPGHPKATLGLVCGDPEVITHHCPYGMVGDRLWVKETWAAAREYDHLAPSEIPASGRSRLHYLADGPKPDWAGKTRVSIHMPRWASRTTLEIPGVRVERLHSISEPDARAEGVEEVEPGLWRCYDPAVRNPLARCHSARGSFLTLWDSINGWTYPTHSSDPWLWVVEFRPLEVKRA